MNLSPVILAIPIFFTLMGLELVYESITRRKTYRLNDAVTNISTGTLQQLVGTLGIVFTIAVYTFVYEHTAFIPFENNWVTFATAMVLWDLCYYWEHRMAHRISLFWGGHSVHHQSEDYNLSVALRQTSTGFLWGFFFFIPMALLGIPPETFALVGGLNLLYQFWIHTEHIKKLPRWFEYVFNTPSHHRVHHGRDPKYIDKNYAGILILWDRMFGTFKEEEERPHYGLTKPLQSWNPVYANFAHYLELFKTVGKARNVSDGIKILFKPPGWLPEYLGGYQAPLEVRADYQKYSLSQHSKMNIYVLVQFGAAAMFNAFYFFQNKGFDDTTKWLFALWIILTTVMFGFMFESKNRIWILVEALRLLLMPIGMYVLNAQLAMGLPMWGIILVGAFAVASLIVFIRLHQRDS